jgi:hypothetical protein
MRRFLVTDLTEESVDPPEVLETEMRCASVVQMPLVLETAMINN